MLSLGEEFGFDSAVIWMLLLLMRWACQAFMGVASCCLS
jgi:hypothetical protein